MQTHEIQTIIASIPTEIYSELQQFAIDNNFVTEVTGFPKVAECICEIARIFTMVETDEEIRLVIKLFFKPKKWKGNGAASTIMEMVDIVLDIHRDPRIKVVRKELGCTTLECLNTCILIVLTFFRINGMRDDNVEDFLKETEKEFKSFLQEYINSERGLSIEDK